MEVERLEVIPYALPFREPYVTVRGRLDRRELVLVRAYADGLVGLGESASLSLRGGEPLGAVVADLDENGVAATSLPGQAAVEIALLDLAGKAAGTPAWQVLGAADARPVRCNATLTAGAPEDVAGQARAWSERGFETFKLKCGMEGDVEQVATARAALSGDARIRVDANGAWNVAEAAERLGAMGPLELAEQPVGTLDELHALSELTDVPLAADESVVDHDDARSAATACRYATVKLAKVGGPAAALAIARELPVYVSSALEGPVGIAAAAHVVQVLPDPGVAHGLATGLLFAESVGRGAELEGPMLSVPEGPGLGVEIDEDALARLRL